MHYNYKDNKTKKTTLVFIHGFLGGSEIWKSYESYFGENYSTLTVDLYGHGKSTENPDCSLECIAEKISKIIKRLPIANCVLIGHSMGGYISGYLLEFLPQKIKGIVLLNSSLLGDSKGKQEQRNRAIEIARQHPYVFVGQMVNNLFLQENLAVFSEEVKQYQQLAKRVQPETIIKTLIHLRDRKSSVERAKIMQVPTLYITSKHDTTIPYSLIEQQLPELKARVIVLEKSNHMSFWEEKNTVLLAIESFLLSLNL